MKKTIEELDPRKDPKYPRIDFSNHPFFLKKAAAAKAFIEKHGLPPGLMEDLKARQKFSIS